MQKGGKQEKQEAHDQTYMKFQSTLKAKEHTVQPSRPTSNIGAAVGLQSTNIDTFPLSGRRMLGFPSSACKTQS